MKCQGTADRKGQQRFVGMDPNFMATFRGDKGYFKKVFEYWGKATGGFKWGIDLISEQSIGFHNLRYAAFMYRIYALFHPEACPSDSILVQNMLEAGVKVKGVAQDGKEDISSSGENQDGSDTNTDTDEDDDKDNKDNEKDDDNEVNDDDTSNNDDYEEVEEGESKSSQDIGDGGNSDDNNDDDDNDDDDNSE